MIITLNKHEVMKILAEHFGSEYLTPISSRHETILCKDEIY